MFVQKSEPVPILAPLSECDLTAAHFAASHVALDPREREELTNFIASNVKDVGHRFDIGRVVEPAGANDSSVAEEVLVDRGQPLTTRRRHEARMASLCVSIFTTDADFTYFTRGPADTSACVGIVAHAQTDA